MNFSRPAMVIKLPSLQHFGFLKRLAEVMGVSLKTEKRRCRRPVGRFTASLSTSLISFFIMLNLSLLSPALSQPPTPDSGWQSFERMVRDGNVSYREGEKAVAEWADRLERNFPRSQFQKNIFFPLTGYSIKDVGGKNGDGYKPKGYRFLDGNRHQGHPAQDIFVRDRDQDGLDDLTRRPVDVMALAEGIVLSAFTHWNKEAPGREIRGGNYVWIYHPALDAFSYYAHLEKVFVGPEKRVQGGQAIATLGRSGKNASLPRSPTHLHLMLLSSGNMEPINPYPILRSSIPVRSAAFKTVRAVVRITDLSQRAARPDPVPQAAVF